jgi:hypothetical protein
VFLGLPEFYSDRVESVEVRECIINFRSQEYLAILERLGIEEGGSLGYHKVLQLWTESSTGNVGTGVSRRLLHEELSKTHYP